MQPKPLDRALGIFISSYMSSVVI